MTPTTPYAETGHAVDGFSPKKLILQIKGTAGYVLRKWFRIMLVALACGLAAAAYTYLKKPNYLAEITFAIDEEATQAPKSGLTTLSEELGLGSQLDAGTVFSSVTNIVELMRSRLLIEKTLRSSVTIDNKTLSFADFFLDSLDYREKWMKNSAYYQMHFLTPKKDKKEMLFENSILRNIYETLTNKNITIDKKGKGTSIISVTCLSEHELFSKYFLEAWLNEVTQYYIETKTQRSRNNVAVIQKRADSVKTAYYGALHGRAAFADAHSNTIRQTVSVTGERQQTDVQILRNSYVDLVNTLESARTTLMRETPLIQYLDMPILPLKMVKASMIKRFLLCFVLGAFLMVGYFVMRRLYQSIVNSR